MGSSATESYDSIGFIGLGAMGLPMAKHLANKLPSETRIYVFDVAAQAMENFSAEFPRKIVKCGSAREVAQQTVDAPPKKNLVRDDGPSADC